MKNKNGDTVIRQACGTKMAGIGWLRIKAEDGSIDTGLYTWSNSITAPELLGLENEMSALIREKVGEVNNQLQAVVAKTAVELTVNDPKRFPVNCELIHIPVTGDHTENRFLALYRKLTEDRVNGLQLEVKLSFTFAEPDRREPIMVLIDHKSSLGFR